MKRENAARIRTAKAAICALAEIQAATDAFDRCESNVFEVLDAVLVALEAYRAGEPSRHEAA